MSTSPFPKILLTATLVYFSLLTATAAPVAEGPEFFAKQLLPILETAQCRQCHNANGIASRTRLQFPDAEAGAGRIEAFALSLRALIEPSRPDQSLLLRKPTQRIEHTGGQRIVPGGPEEQILLAWINYLARQSPDEAAPSRNDAARPQGKVRRLTHSQYNNTVHDLLADQTLPAGQFPQEDVIHGYRNQIEGQGIPPLLAEAYNRAAERLARNAFRGGDQQSLIPCRPASANDAECRNAFIASFGRNAFRRPLTPEEIDTYGKLFTLGAAEQGEFIEGARIVVETMLQSPSFLFYAEPSPPAALRPYQTASLLSYFLWDTLPDEPLLEAAAAGRLDSGADIEKQIRRMLKDPRARQALNQFLAQWLRFDRVETAVRDRRLYPEFSAELVDSMIEETRLLFNAIVWDGRDFTEFFSAGYGFLDTALARLYDLPPPSAEFQKVVFPADSGRAGILGQATFLTVTSKPADTSPTERGLFVRQHFLCQTVPPPPPGVDTTLPALSDDKPMTVRGRLAVHLSNPACAGCHRLVDGIGFGFERYDAVGRFRNEEIVKIFPTQDELRRKVKTEPSEYKLPIDPSASVYGLPNSDFSSPSELGRYLAQDEGCQRCIVKQLFRYAVGRLENDSDQPSIDAAFKRFRDSRFQLQELIIAVATSESFLGKSKL
ncbi:MAG: DUF1592 domain-containing protein [Acidobacteria bacterium]|nr:DUF1592 domain-containing protein [Acidobacteriota bacterium]